jgi:uncharacterized protein YjdB
MRTTGTEALFDGARSRGWCCAAFALLTLLTLHACSSPSEAPSPYGVNVNTPSLNLQGIGQSQTVQATVVDRRNNPIAGAGVNWSSNNTAVATVSGSGSSATITSAGPGSAVITAQSSTGTGSATVTVTVTAELLSVSAGASSVALDFTTNSTRVLSATGTGHPGVTPAFTWVSSSPSIVSVAPASGATTTLTAVAAGTATVTLRGVSQFGGTQRTADVSVTVTGIVRSVTVSPSAGNLTVGSTLPLQVTVDADPGVSRSVTWQSGNQSVATVSTSGVVTAVTPGIVTIVAASQANPLVFGQATLQVQGTGRTVTVTPKTANVTVGSQVTLQGSASGEAGFPTTVAWLSRNVGVATVNAVSGTVTGVAVGTVRIVATATGDATVKDSASVTVTAPAQTQAVTSFRTVKAPPMSGMGGRFFDEVHDVAYSPAGQLLVAADCSVSGRTGNAFTSAQLPGDECPIRFHSTGAALFALTLEGGVFRWTSGLSFTRHALAALPQSVFQGMFWVAPTGEAFVVGYSFTTGFGVYRLAGGAWTSLSPPAPPSELMSIWGNSATDVIVGGVNGWLYRFNGLTWTAVQGWNANTILWDAWSAGDGVYYLAASDGAWRLNGATLTRLDTEEWFAVRGTTSTDVLFSRDGYGRWNGTAFQPVFIEASLGESSFGLTRFALGGSEIASIWGHGTVRAHPRTTPITSAASMLSMNPPLLDVAVTSRTHAVAVGDWGQVVRWNGTTWQSEQIPTYYPMFAVASLGPTQTWAGGWGVWFSNGSSWQEVVGGSQTIYGIWANSATDVWAVGLGGIIWRFNGTSWARVDAGTTEPLLSVWGTGPGNVFIGGPNFILRYNGTSFQQFQLGPGNYITGIHGTGPNDVYAARYAQQGMLRFNGTTWAILADTVDVKGQGVWANSANDVYLAGDCIRRFGGTAWSAMDCNFPGFMHSIEGLAAGGAVGVGDAGRLWLGQNAGGGFGFVGTQSVASRAARLGNVSRTGSNQAKWRTRQGATGRMHRNAVLPMRRNDRTERR